MRSLLWTSGPLPLLLSAALFTSLLRSPAPASLAPGPPAYHHQPAVGRSQCQCSDSADPRSPRLMRIAEPRGPGSTLPALPVSPCLDRGAGLTTANQSRTCSPLDHFEPFWTPPLTSRPLPTRVWHTPVSIAVAYPPSVTTVYDICPWTCPCPDSHRTVFASAPSWDHREKARLGFGPDLRCRNTHYAAHGIPLDVAIPRPARPRRAD